MLKEKRCHEVGTGRRAAVPMDNCTSVQGTRSKALPSKINSGFTQLSRSLPVPFAVICAFRELYSYFYFFFSNLFGNILAAP